MENISLYLGIRSNFFFFRIISSKYDVSTKQELRRTQILIENDNQKALLVGKNLLRKKKE